MFSERRGDNTLSLNEKIENLEIGTRMNTFLKNSKIDTISNLISKPINEYSIMPGFPPAGLSQMEELRQLLENKGILWPQKLQEDVEE